MNFLQFWSAVVAVASLVVAVTWFVGRRNVDRRLHFQRMAEAAERRANADD